MDDYNHHKLEIADFVSRKRLIVNGEGHIKGRLASICVKALLLGRNVVVLNTEKITQSGTLRRKKLAWEKFWQQRCNVNPARGPYHYKSPKAMFYRCVRGMLPRQTLRGRKAIRNLKVYVGTPPKYRGSTSLVVPCATKMLQARPDYKWHLLGKLSKDIGWKYDQVVRKLGRKAAERKRVVLKKKKFLKRMKKVCQLQTRRDTSTHQKRIRNAINDAHRREVSIVAH